MWQPTCLDVLVIVVALRAFLVAHERNVHAAVGRPLDCRPPRIDIFDPYLRLLAQRLQTTSQHPNQALVQ
jgi:hypothetical protein